MNIDNRFEVQKTEKHWKKAKVDVTTMLDKLKDKEYIIVSTPNGVAVVPVE